MRDRVPVAANVARRQLPAARVADRPGEARRPLPAAGAGQGAVAGRARRSSPRRRTTRRCSRSAPRSAPGWTSSPTARSAGRATPTTSPPRSTGSTSTTPVRRSTAAATPTRCPASSARSAGRTRSRCATCEFLRAHTDRPVKITVPGPFTMTSRRRTTTTPTSSRPRWTTPTAVNAEIKDLFAAGADVVQIDEPYLQARPDAARAYGARRAERGARRRRRARPPCTSASATPRSSTSGPSGYSFLAELAGCPVRPDLDRDRAVRARPRRAAPTWRTRRSSSGSSTCRRREVETAEVGRRRGCGGRSRTSPPERLVIAPDCGMKYLPAGVRRGQDAGDGGRRGAAARRSSHDPGGDRRRRRSWSPRTTSPTSPTRAGATARDPRMAELLTALVRHLHDFAREVRLTEDEWMAAIQWLTRTGQISDEKREEFILASDVLGLSMLVVQMNHRLRPGGDARHGARPVPHRGLAGAGVRRRHVRRPARRPRCTSRDGARPRRQGRRRRRARRVAGRRRGRVRGAARRRRGPAAGEVHDPGGRHLLRADDRARSATASRWTARSAT